MSNPIPKEGAWMEKELMVYLVHMATHSVVPSVVGSSGGGNSGSGGSGDGEGGGGDNWCVAFLPSESWGTFHSKSYIYYYIIYNLSQASII